MKKNILSLPILAISLLVGCSKDDGIESDPSKYFYDIPQTYLTEEVYLGCHYIDPAQSIEDGTIIDTPAITPYNVLDGETMKRHTEEASQAGIDYFVFEWNDNLDSLTYNSHELIKNFKDANSPMSYIVKYSHSHLGISTSDQLLSADKHSETVITKLESDLDFLAENYFNEDGVQNIDGRPALMINFSAGDKNTDFGYLADLIRAGLTERLGVDPYIIAEHAAPFTPPERYQIIFKKFDAVTAQNMRPNTYDRRFGYFSFMDINWQLWNESLSSWGVDFIPTVWTAYYRNYEINPSQYYDVERTEENFIDFCNVAKRNMGSNRVILLNSWNNFKFGSSLEPAGDYGDTYLNLTKDQFSVK